MKTIDNATHRARHPRSRHHGLSLVELMVALAISATLLSATMVAVDVSFKAYAEAAEEAGTQAATRMVTNRLMTMIRTNIAHGPLVIPNPPLNIPNCSNPAVTLAGDVISSHFLDMQDSNGTFIRIEYRDLINELWLVINPGTAGQIQQPIMGGVMNNPVTQPPFTLVRRMDDQGLWVLERGTIDFTTELDDQTSIGMEKNRNQNHINSTRVIASTKPRKIN